LRVSFVVMSDLSLLAAIDQARHLALLQLLLLPEEPVQGRMGSSLQHSFAPSWRR